MPGSRVSEAAVDLERIAETTSVPRRVASSLAAADSPDAVGPKNASSSNCNMVTARGHLGRPHRCERNEKSVRVVHESCRECASPNVAQAATREDRDREASSTSSSRSERPRARPRVAGPRSSPWRCDGCGHGERRVGAPVLDQDLLDAPTRSAFRSPATPCTTSTSASRRGCFTSSDTAPGSVAASVPERGEKMKVNALSRPHCLDERDGPSKSSSVSPGKPTMRVRAECQVRIASRRRSTSRRGEPGRRSAIALRTRDDPD